VPRAGLRDEALRALDEAMRVSGPNYILRARRREIAAE
jgi:hypothetical protein